MDIDLVDNLTKEGANFESTWSNFMFNATQALQLQTATKEQILAILQAGNKFSGLGWNTGKASRVLYNLSGVALVKPSWEPYRDIWLFAVALITSTDLPLLQLSPEEAEAAFQVARYLEHPQEEQAQNVEEVDTDSDSEVKFQWDEPETPMPRELMALWQRASGQEHKIAVKDLLEAHPRIAGLPARAPENNLVGEHKRKQDASLKALSQQVLNVLRITAYRWIRPSDPTVELQTWQHLAELYFRLQAERR